MKSPTPAALRAAQRIDSQLDTFWSCQFPMRAEKLALVIDEACSLPELLEALEFAHNCMAWGCSESGKKIAIERMSALLSRHQQSQKTTT